MNRLSSMATIAALMTSAEQEAAALGVTPHSVRATILAVHARALGAEVELAPSTRRLSGPYQSAESLKEVFQRTRVLSKGEPLTALHVLRAAAERRHGTVALVIDELGIDREGLSS